MEGSSTRGDFCDCDFCRPRTEAWAPSPRLSHWGVWKITSVRVIVLGVMMMALTLLYYTIFGYSHLHQLEDPVYDLLIVDKNDPAELAFFRKKSITDVIDPALTRLDRIKALRIESQRGVITPDDYENQRTALNEQLRDIMDVAKMRQIPKVYSKRYEGVLLAIGEAYRSLQALDESMKNQSSAEKERTYRNSLRHSKSAERLLKSGRVFFN